METTSTTGDSTIQIRPVGFVRSPVARQQTGGLTLIESTIELRPELSEYTLGLEQYSHLHIIYWLSEMTETHALHRPQGNPDAPIVGMFASR